MVNVAVGRVEISFSINFSPVVVPLFTDGAGLLKGRKPFKLTR